MQTFICDNIENGIMQMLRYKNNSSLSCPGLTDERKGILVCGQPGIGKKEQLVAIFKRENVKTTELFVKGNIEDTVQRINSIVLSPDDVLVIRNVDLLPRMFEHPTIREFAMQLSLIGNYIVAISNVPYQSSLFYDQFQIVINMTLPPQSYLVSMYKHMFETYAEHCKQQGIDATFDLSDKDYTWLAQSSDSCTPLDVKNFCSKVFYYAADNEPVTIDRAFLENTDNKMMYDLTGCGIQTITTRETFKTQQLFDTSAGAGIVVPPPKKKIKKV